MHRSLVLLALASCASPSPTPTEPTKGPASTSHPDEAVSLSARTGSQNGAEPAESSAKPSSGSTKTATGAPKTTETPQAIFERMKPELVKCYEDGKRAVPTMLDGKLTLNAAIDTSGKTTCVIPTDDTGLTQEVEDCMSSHLAATKVGDGAAPIISVPVAVRGGVVQLGERSNAPVGIESVETHRMPDAFEVIEDLLPELQACVREQDRDPNRGTTSVIIAARVGTDGRTQCALATMPTGTLTRKVGDCAAGAMRAVKFPPPKGGAGLLLVPLQVKRGP